MKRGDIEIYIPDEGYIYFKTIEELKLKLKEIGKDGLYFEGECACEIDDLIPCGNSCADCTAGYKINHKDMTEKDKLDFPSFIVVRDKKSYKGL